MKRITFAVLAVAILLMISGSRIAPKEPANSYLGLEPAVCPEGSRRDPSRAELNLLESHAIAAPSAQAAPSHDVAAEDPIQQGETRTTATVWIWREHRWERKVIPPETPIAIYWYNDHWVRNAPAETPQYIRRAEVFIFGVDVYSIHFPLVSKCDQCANKVHREEDKLVRDGKEIRLIGVNATWLTRGSDLPEEKEEEVLSFLSKYANCVRVWVFPGSDLNQLERLLDLGAKYDLLFVITFETFQEVPEYARFGQTWFEEGYKETYLPFVKETVSRFRNSPQIAFWQLMNEPNPWGWSWGWKSKGVRVFERWIKDVSAEIRASDPCHPISIGLIRVDKIGDEVEPEKWFKEIHTSTEADLVTAHVHQNGGKTEVDLANEIGYPIVFTEVWVERSPNIEKRRYWVLRFAEERLDRGADGLLLWQFRKPGQEYAWEYEVTEDEIPVWEALRELH
jgi:hypothetical protein